MTKNLHQKGFTLIEILISLFVIGILLGIVVVNLNKSKKETIVKTVTDTLLFRLEEARANALAGKGGENQGVKLNDDSYIVFSGLEYNSSDPDNVVYELDSNVSLSDTTTNTDRTVIFSRLTGGVEESSTITISSDSGVTRTISIDLSGNIDLQ